MKNKTKKIDLERWFIRLSSLAVISSLYMTVTADEKDKNDPKFSIITTAGAILGGIGLGVASHKLISRERN